MLLTAQFSGKITFPITGFFTNIYSYHSMKLRRNDKWKNDYLELTQFLDEFPDCNEIVLAVNHKNIAAQKLYLKVGLQDTGIRKMGVIGEQYIMNLKL